MTVSNKLPFDKQEFKYFIGYKYGTGCMVYFSIKDETFLKKHNEIWEKVSNIIKK